MTVNSVLPPWDLTRGETKRTDGWVLECDGHWCLGRDCKGRMGVVTFSDPGAFVFSSKSEAEMTLAYPHVSAAVHVEHFKAVEHSWTAGAEGGGG